MGNSRETGIIGEQAAINYLEKEGYEVVETNWRFRRAEIDIIARKNKILIFIEVKTRSYDFFGKPENFVNFRKKQLMVDASSAYMERINHTWEIRFDIISVIIRNNEVLELNHFEDAFFPGIE